MDLKNKTIEKLFYQQMRELTLRTNKRLKSFDRQFIGEAG